MAVGLCVFQGSIHVGKLPAVPARRETIVEERFLGLGDADAFLRILPYKVISPGFFSPNEQIPRSLEFCKTQSEGDLRRRMLCRPESKERHRRWPRVRWPRGERAGPGDVRIVVVFAFRG